MLPEQAVSRINHNQDKKIEGIEGQVAEFKNALQKILTDDALPPETQMQLYNQLFTRYLKLDTDSKEPATIIMKAKESDKETELTNDKIEQQNFQDQWKDAIFQKMPKMHKERAKGLIKFLKKSKVDTGEVSINNTLLPQSNIVNLVHDIVRDRPKAPGPLGFQDFVMLLRDLNVPKSWLVIHRDGI